MSTPSTGSLPARLAPLVEILRAAARDALEGFRTPAIGFERKGDGSRVTAVDRRLDAFLREALSALGEGPVRSEEHPLEGDAGGPWDGWVVDPIDGTHPFTEGDPGFSVQVAHLVGGRPDRAALALPAAGELYLAERGSGVWRAAAAGGTPEPWRLPAEADPTLRAHDWKIRGEDRARLARELALIEGPWARAIGPMIATLVRGESRAVVCPPPLCDWDLAPPELIAAELGARVTDLEGEGLRYGRPDVVPGRGVVVTAPGVDHDRLLASVRSMTFRVSEG